MSVLTQPTFQPRLWVFLLAWVLIPMPCSLFTHNNTNLCFPAIAPDSSRLLHSTGSWQVFPHDVLPAQPPARLLHLPLLHKELGPTFSFGETTLFMAMSTDPVNHMHLQTSDRKWSPETYVNAVCDQGPVRCAPVNSSCCSCGVG